MSAGNPALRSAMSRHTLQFVPASGIRCETAAAGLRAAVTI